MINPLKGLLGNKTVLNLALSQIRDYMKKDGISAIVIQAVDDNPDSETPGLDLKSYGEPIGILSGVELKNYPDDLKFAAKYRAALDKEIHGEDPVFTAPDMQLATPEQIAALARDGYCWNVERGMWTKVPEKEVNHAL
jgi:hypothetical protein